MTKLHQLKPKPEAGAAPPGAPPGTPILPETQALQVTFGRDVHVLLARLVANELEKGARPSQATKSAVVERAIRALAKAEGVQP
jgi:hypothetical protein